MQEIDSLKEEGCWNNDWEASLELIKRIQRKKSPESYIPSLENLVQIFNNFYFGGDINGNPELWEGLIRNERLLVNKSFFKNLSNAKIRWGFVSGAETQSANYVLQNRLGIKSPPLIAMGDAPDKPDPTGLIQLAKKLAEKELGQEVNTVSYLGDTVADILTVVNAKKEIPSQKFKSFGIAPPHLHDNDSRAKREEYEKKLINSGADCILKSITDIIDEINT